MDVSGSRGAPPIAQDTHPVASRAIPKHLLFTLGVTIPILGRWQ